MIYRYGNFECVFTSEKKGARPILVQQVHGDKVVHFEPNREVQEADAILSLHDQDPYVFTADCLPLLFFSDSSSARAAAHCGWRGALAGIAEKTLRACSRYASVTNWQVVLGPAILPCCFEVKQDFIDEFSRLGYGLETFLSFRQEKIYFDLPRWVIETQLSALAPSAVHREPMRCTVCSAPELPSYRRNGIADPRICSLVRKRNRASGTS